MSWCFVWLPAVAHEQRLQSEAGDATRRGMDRTLRAATLSNLLAPSRAMGVTKSLRVRFNLQQEAEPTSYLFDPNEKLVVQWKFCSLLFDCVSFFRLPIVIAFGQHHILFDLVPDIYFFLDHVMALNTGFYQKDVLVKDRRSIVKRYLSWDHFLTGDRGSIYVFIMEFIPFYACIIVMSYISLPFWVLSVSALPRGRRTYDLLDFFYRREVRIHMLCGSSFSYTRTCE